MTLALAQYEDFSSLLEVTFIGVRMTCQIGYRSASTLMCIAMMELCHSTAGFLYLFAE